MEISAEEFVDLVRRYPDAVVVDVRFDYEREENGSLPGARQIPIYMPDWEPNPDFVGQVSQVARAGQPLVFVCRSGHRSCEACDLVNLPQVQGVYSLREGMAGLQGKTGAG